MKQKFEIRIGVSPKPDGPTPGKVNSTYLTPHFSPQAQSRAKEQVLRLTVLRRKCEHLILESIRFLQSRC